MTRKTQTGPISGIHEQVDSVYLDTDDDCVIEDPAMGRCIRIIKSGSRSTVVWNPWQAKAASMSDFGNDEYSAMVCVETANAADDVVTVDPGGEHQLATVISAAPR